MEAFIALPLRLGGRREQSGGHDAVFYLGGKAIFNSPVRKNKKGRDLFVYSSFKTILFFGKSDTLLFRGTIGAMDKASNPGGPDFLVVGLLFFKRLGDLR